MGRPKTTTNQASVTPVYIAPGDASVVFDEKENTRVNKYSKGEIKDKALDIVQNGQLQPIRLRKLEDGTLKLIFGYGRWLAGQYIVENHDKNFKLWAVVDEGTDDRTAFLQSVSENHKRKETTPIDDAYNMERMIQPVEEGGLGMTQKEVSVFYGLTAAAVSQRLSLRVLSKKMQKAISDGLLPLRAALVLVSIESESRRERAFEKEMEKIKNGQQRRANTSSITQEAREAAQEALEEAEATEPPPKQSRASKGPSEAADEEEEEEEPTTLRPRRSPATRIRTVQEVRLFFEQMHSKDMDHPDAVRKLAKDVVAYINGKIGDADLQVTMLETIPSQ